MSQDKAQSEGEPEAEWQVLACGICGAYAGKPCEDDCATVGCECPTHRATPSAQPAPEPSNEQQTELAKAVRAFLAKFDEAEPFVEGIYRVAHTYGVAYGGPTYESELGAVRAALRAPEPQQEQPREGLTPDEKWVQQAAERLETLGFEVVPKEFMDAWRAEQDALYASPPPAAIEQREPSEGDAEEVADIVALLFSEDCRAVAEVGAYYGARVSRFTAEQRAALKQSLLALSTAVAQP